MIIEQELKDRCTPEFIKWMCELAEGFGYQEENDYDVNYFIWNNKKYFTSSDVLFPLLIHRAVEGIILNESYRYVIAISPITVSYGNKYYRFKDYQPQNLTPAECACLHCLLDIFEGGNYER